MSGHNVIAICQYGGEFVTEEDGSLSYKGGDAHAMQVDDQMKYDDFKTELVEMLNCNICNVSVKYFLPSNRKIPITISNEKDLKNMMKFHNNATTIDIYVLKEEEVVLDASNMTSSRSSGTTAIDTYVLKEEEVILDASNMPSSRSSGTTAINTYVLKEEEVVLDASNMPSSRSSGTTMSEEDEDFVDAVPLDAVDPTNQHDDMFDSSFASEADTTHVPSDFPEVVKQWQNTITGVSQRFNSVSEFRESLRNYAIANQFDFKYKKNDSNRVTVKCKDEGCPWQIHASRLPSTKLICIKKMNSTHTCEGSAVMSGHQATWIANIIKEKLRADPSYKPKDIATDIKQEYGVQLNYVQAWRGKEMAKEKLQGSYSEAYKKLPLFCEKIIETNPGSLATFTTKDDSSFQRVFVSFHASLSGFQQGCRPLLFLDSIPLVSKYQGMMLAATAVDGDDGVFPIAFVVVDLETNDNWHWFLLQLKTALSSSHGLTIVADREKGIKESIAEIFSDVGVHHGHCIHYLSEQLLRDMKGEISHELKQLMIEDLFAAAYAPKPADFLRILESIKTTSLEAYNWVMQSEPANWANAYFPGARFSHLTSKFGELFYSWVSEAHDFPIIQLIDALRGKITELINNRKEESDQWLTRLTPSMEELLKKESSKVGSFQVMVPVGNKFEVRGELTEIVDIDQWDCTCKGWQLTGLPCCHAIAVINCIGHNPYDYCSSYLTTDSYKLTYSENISYVPILNGPMQKGFVNVTPPPTRRPPGRPSKKQNVSQEMAKRQLQCSRCKGAGRNKSTCKEFSLEC